MAAATILCEHCGGASQVQPAWLGQQVACPHCGQATAAVAAPAPPPVAPLSAVGNTPASDPSDAVAPTPPPSPPPAAPAEAPPGDEVLPASRPPLSRAQRRAIQRRRQLFIAIGCGVALVAAAYGLLMLRS
ncbi:MAG: hypothetical protein CMJ58_23350 [Planctomycetaceae bacterium]|nr:hypothetical protein [Planctomycetaceae bacterium]